MTTTNNLLRITQIDANHLDNEIYRILCKCLTECTSHLSPGLISAYESELRLLTKLFLLKYSIFENGITFGQKMLAIKYKNMSRFKRILYCIFGSAGYLKEKVEMSPYLSKFGKTVFQVETFIKICSLLNLSLFMRYGKMPLLIDRILGLEQVYTHNVQRQFGSKYLTRELLWNSFIEILIYILPLINYHKTKRILKKYNPFYKPTVFSTSNTRTLTAWTMCAHCSSPPILPCHMGCSHVFCYTCLKGNQVADSRYECPLCEYSPKESICERIVM